MPPYLKGWLKIMQACLKAGILKTVELTATKKRLTCCCKQISLFKR
jgi:hypothetical protein